MDTKRMYDILVLLLLILLVFFMSYMLSSWIMQFSIHTFITTASATFN
jgi:hypothetical protein